MQDALKEAEKKHKDEARALAEKYTVAVARLTAVRNSQSTTSSLRSPRRAVRSWGVWPVRLQSEKAVGDGDAAMAMLKEKLKLKMQKIKAVKGEAARVVAVSLHSA